MAAVHPDQRDRGSDEMEQDVGEPERGRSEGDRLEGALHPSLDVDADRLLDRDDVRRVRECRLDVLATGAPDDLVEAVEDGETADLTETGVGMGEPGANHGPTLPSRARRDDGVSPRPAVR